MKHSGLYVMERCEGIELGLGNIMRKCHSMKDNRTIIEKSGAWFECNVRICFSQRSRMK